jgi:rhodanese-related sulfurtransferase/peroxiredoxin
MIGRLQNITSWDLISEGRPAPRLSLTADEGTWIRLQDFKGHINAVLIFFRSLSDDATDAALKQFHQRREQFEELDTALFGITSYRPDKLRDFRASLGLEFFLLYDPLAMDSRGFRASSRVRPTCKNTVYVIGKDGNILSAWRGLPDVAEVLSVIARSQGVEVQDHTSGEDGASSGADDQFTGVRNPGQRADRVKDISSDSAVEMMSADDSSYVLLDVRTTSEYDADHAPQAMHIPVDELPHRYQEVGQTTHIICICQAGGRSAAAAEFLTSIGGSEIYNVEGGMSSWTGDRVTGGEVQA